MLCERKVFTFCTSARQEMDDKLDSKWVGWSIGWVLEIKSRAETERVDGNRIDAYVHD